MSYCLNKMHKIILFIAISGLLSFAAHAQVGLLSVPLELYKPSDPNLTYWFIDNDSVQRLDYSGNWDFDGDGEKDSLTFIGNSGAHLYFHLRIRLSSDQKVRVYPYLNFDSPFLGTISQLEKAFKEDSVPISPQIVVHDFDGYGIDEIYLCYDSQWSSIPKKWKKQGITSRNIMLKYEKKDKDIVVRNFKWDLLANSAENR